LINRILHGSAYDKLKELDSESVDCCITSPPYWALRDYKTEGQLGLEPTFQEYITKLIEIFNQVKRVLKKTGSCWVNIGDTYSGSGGASGHNEDSYNKAGAVKGNEAKYKQIKPDNIPAKSLCLIPQRFAIAMVDAGWICRNTIIWYKPNCMPSSAKDRFTVDFEYLFFFTKSQRYYFDTQYEPLESLDSPGGWQTARMKGLPAPFGGKKAKIGDGYNNGTYSGKEWNPSPLGRIKRCVWKIPTQPFSEAHFAVFPPQLVETPLKACCPEFVCRRCGKPREKIVEKGELILGQHKRPNIRQKTDDPKLHYWSAVATRKAEMINDAHYDYKTVGLTDCGCNAAFDPGVCLDPFIGSGTVGLVAMQNARNFLGIELNADYIKMAYRRLEPYLSQTKLI
jgi:site-specific DNA-methyltransferase (adenine-specific)